MSRAGLAARLALLAGAGALVIPTLLLLRLLGWRGAEQATVGFHRLFLRLFGVRVRVEGSPPPPGRPTLILANHVSWLDIPVMASLIPMSFIAKSEIASWPLAGHLARVQRCIFVDRGRRGATAEVNALVGRRLARGDAIALFPEGTTGDGVRLLPFRSSLVGAARAALGRPDLDRVWLQPLALRYVGRRGLPVTRRDLPDIAWYGDTDLAPHLAAFVRGGSLDVRLAWGEPVPFDGRSDRKLAAAAAEREVRRCLERLRGGPDPAGPILLAGRPS